MAGAPAPTPRKAGILSPAGRYFSAGELPLFRCRGKPGEDRCHLSLLRTFRFGEREDGEIFLRGLDGGRGGDCPADAAVPRGEAQFRAIPPPSPAGLLGGGVEWTDPETSSFTHSALMGD